MLKATHSVPMTSRLTPAANVWTWLKDETTLAGWRKLSSDTAAALAAGSPNVPAGGMPMTAFRWRRKSDWFPNGLSCSPSPSAYIANRRQSGRTTCKPTNDSLYLRGLLWSAVLRKTCNSKRIWAVVKSSCSMQLKCWFCANRSLIFGSKYSNCEKKGTRGRKVWATWKGRGKWCKGREERKVRRLLSGLTYGLIAPVTHI